MPNKEDIDNHEKKKILVICILIGCSPMLLIIYSFGAYKYQVFPGCEAIASKKDCNNRQQIAPPFMIRGVVEVVEEATRVIWRTTVCGIGRALDGRLKVTSEILCNRKLMK